MNLLGITGAEIMDSVRSFFEKIFAVFSELWFWPIIFLGVMLVAVVVLAFLVKYSYENRILKSVNKLNKYFLAKPFITEENLVEFNLKMKKVPKVLRNNWQIYMLNREDSPTTYINVNTCIDKPLRTSSIEKNMSNFSIFTILLGFLAFVTGIRYSIVLMQNTFAEALFTATLVPLGIALIYTISILAFRASKNDIYACLYDNFPLYERNLTKAVTTLPAYVDYEILFTKKEIKEGIPILQQYLEKRALVEQQELEKARENSLAVEEYDFSDLGVDGSLILERSMKESETFIKIRRRLQEEISTIEAEKDGYKKNFEETLKDMQRKLQASRENLESLKTQQEESTNRIESNYIRKQQADEIKKQEQLEKDIEAATSKFNDEQTSLQQEIEKRQQEIEEKKEFVRQAMLLEFKHYANTLYKALTEKAAEVGNQKLLTLAQENSDLKTLLTDIQGVGATEEMTDPTNSLIQNQDLTAENLYDMTSSDINEMEEARNDVNQVEQVGEQDSAVNNLNNDYQEEQQFQGEVNSNYNDNANKYETSQEDVNDNVQYNNKADTQSENQLSDSLLEEQSSNENNVETSQNNVDDNITTTNQLEQEGQNTYQEDSNDDNGQVYSNQNDVEDLEQIQRQIDENNKILQQNKQEFENDLNNTISKIDARRDGLDSRGYNQQIQNDLQQSYNQPYGNNGFDNSQQYYGQPQGFNQNQFGYNQQPFAQQVGPQQPYMQQGNQFSQQLNTQPYVGNIYSQPQNFQQQPPIQQQFTNQNYASQNDAQYMQPQALNEDDYEEKEEVRPKTRRKVVDDDNGRGRRTTRRTGRVSRASSRTSSKAQSEIDALNAEMQKLLDSNSN